jgi:hypothetical protein
MRYPQLVQGELRVTSISLLGALGYLEVALCVGALCVLIARKQWADYAALGLFLAVRIASNAVLTYAHHAVLSHSLTKVAAYHIYFYVYWTSFAIESILTLIVVYSVFKLAMAPLKGLQTLGMLVFK